MRNRLNFSSINDAWGVDVKPETPRTFSYRKPKENTMSIDSNEIKMANPVKETYAGYIKPCTLVEEHIHTCDICKNKLLKNIHPNIDNSSIIDKLDKTREHMTSNILNMSKEYLDAGFDLNEHFENISPSQKNLIIIVLYGILIILISDLIIKEKNE